MSNSSHSIPEDDVNEYQTTINEVLVKLEDTIKSSTRGEVCGKTLKDCISKLRENLLSHKDLSVEFGAFSWIASYLRYFFIDKPKKLVGNEEFVDSALSVFSNLLEAKLDYLVKRDKTSKEEYDKQYKLYREKYFEHEMYFHLNIYEPSHKYDKECNDLGRILIKRG